MAVLRRRSQIRRKAAKAKRVHPLRVPRHYQWVGGWGCCVCGEAEGIHRHHLTTDIPWADQGGTSEKNHDKWCVPLCGYHHDLLHNMGERTFLARLGVDLHETARMLWRKSPHRTTWELARREQDELDGSVVERGPDTGKMR